MTPTDAANAPPLPVDRSLELRGIDFTSRPTRRKPIRVAIGHWLDDGTAALPRVRLSALRSLDTPAAYAASLAEPGPWLAGCDLPFGLPRELVESLGWPTRWQALIDHYAALDRPTIRATFAAFCAARPTGRKFAHRACDGPAGSSPSMKWVNPPVAYMLHAGLPPLLAAGCELPGLCTGDPLRRALEAYPGLLARELLGRTPYKSDDRARQSPAHQAARERLVSALEDGQTRLALRLVVGPALRAELVGDPRGDALDALLCLLQAAWASRQPRWGWPPDVDPLEGWILSA